MRQQKGEASVPSSLHPQLLLPLPPYFTHVVPFTTGRPCPPEWGGGGGGGAVGWLAKVVNGQPEHVIGAHPRIVNVLQEETLMETHDRVVIYLRTHTGRAGDQDTVVYYQFTPQSQERNRRVIPSVPS